MKTLPGPLEPLDVRLTRWMARYGVLTPRVAPGFVFLWVGALERIGAPPYFVSRSL